MIVWKDKNQGNLAIGGTPGLNTAPSGSQRGLPSDGARVCRQLLILLELQVKPSLLAD